MINRSTLPLSDWPHRLRAGGLLLCCICVFRLAQAATYNQTIYLTTATWQALRPAVTDLQQYLSKATHTTIRLVQTDTLPATGIVLRQLPLSDTLQYPDFDHQVNDAVWLRSDGQQQMQIAAFTTAALQNGIYTYMDELGFRWYRPGDEYAFVPALRNIGCKIDRVVKPAFSLRTFFGTFGTPRNAIIDKNKTVDKSWNDWYRRNRFGGSYVLKGHSWNDFLWRNAATLKAHPEYMAWTGGQRSSVNTASKFCISNPGFQQLFVRDMVKQLQRQMKQQPDALRYILSVEPSDGDGYCRCEQCAKLGGVSNAVFYLANLTAKALRNISPKAYVNLYAYYTHAAPPDFALEPNVIVQLIPYGYQQYVSADVMIEQWARKTPQLFLYDYYGSSLTALDQPLPAAAAPEQLAIRLRYWHRLGIRGITLESSYSAITTTPGLYLFARLSWDLDEPVDELMAKYYWDSYGPAAESIEACHEVLSHGSANRKEALMKALEMMNSARLPPAKDSVLCRNVANYRAYLHYLFLLYDVYRAGKSELNAKVDEWLSFVYGTWFRMIVHPFAISDYLLHKSPASAYVQQHWNYLKPADAGMRFAEVLPLSDEAINRLCDSDWAELKKRQAARFNHY